jgi:DNA-binding response OmpR family regulator
VADPTPATPANPQAQGPARLLLADDEVHLRRLFASFLRRSGWDVIEVGGGQEAMEAVTRARDDGRPVALLICDLSMPGPRGEGLVRALRQAGHEQPVLFMTGYASEDVIAGICGAGDRRLITKPFSREALCAKVAAILRGEAPDA